jgi:ATP-binding cassette, subfamily B, multidrug efflux pump
MSQEEEVLGKAYDSRLMARLLKYLRPYRWQVAIALVSIVLKSFADVLGPYLTKVAIDRYLAPAKGNVPGIWSWLNSRPIIGIAQIAAIYVSLLVFSFLLEFLQTYLMQWTGQKVMFDLRSQLYRHLQRHGHCLLRPQSRGPPGHARHHRRGCPQRHVHLGRGLHRRRCLRTLAGILAVMLCHEPAKLSLISFPGAAHHRRRHPALPRQSVRDSYRRIRVAIARINSFLSGARQRHHGPLQLFNRERKSYHRIRGRQSPSHMDAYKDAIMAYALYYPAVEILSAIAIACVIWFAIAGRAVKRHGGAALP